MTPRDTSVSLKDPEQSNNGCTQRDAQPLGEQGDVEVKTDTYEVGPESTEYDRCPECHKRSKVTKETIVVHSAASTASAS